MTKPYRRTKNDLIMRKTNKGSHYNIHTEQHKHQQKQEAVPDAQKGELDVINMWHPLCYPFLKVQSW